MSELKEIRFVINGELVSKIQDEISQNCKHEIMISKINQTRYRYCKHCGMIAHEDGRFDYCCGNEYCKCCQ